MKDWTSLRILVALDLNTGDLICVVWRQQGKNCVYFNINLQSRHWILQEIDLVIRMDEPFCLDRRFLLEWLSFLHRYVPVGLLEVVPQHIQWRPQAYFGRNDLETLLASDKCEDWIKISSIFLGPPPASFTFRPKHVSNGYVTDATGASLVSQRDEQENGWWEYNYRINYAHCCWEDVQQ